MASKRSGKSRGSSKSEKSKPTENSKDGIDLTKEDEIKLDDKIELDDKAIDFDATSGELSTEKTLWEDEEDGESVSAVAGVDLIPTGINISASGDVGSIGVDIGLPGDVVGIGVNVQIDLTSGDIIGGGASGSYGGLSVGVDHIKKDGETCTIITVTYMGIGANYQRCKKDDEDDEKDPPKEPPPPPGEDEIPPANLPPLTPVPGRPGDIIELLLGDTYNTVFHLSQSYVFNGETYVLSTKRTDGYTKSWSFVDKNSRGMPITAMSTTNYRADITNYYNNSSLVRTDTTPARTITSNIGSAGGFYIKGEYTVVVANDTVQHYNKNIGGIINSTNGGDGNWWKTTVKGYDWNCPRILWARVNGVVVEPPKPPEVPNPPIPPEKKMSECCNLEPVMSLLRKVSTAIGTDELPAMMPKSFLKNEGFRKIPSLAELQVYHIEILDQLLGKFPIELEIKDTDPLTEGDQTKKVVLQNVAETLAELFGLSVNSASDSAIQTTGTIKNLLEITLVRQAVLQNYYRLDAILDYLGAGLEEDTTTFNSTISMPKDANNISEDPAVFLQQSEIKFAYDKLANPKDTLTAKLLPIQKAADIIKAKYWKGFGKAGGDYIGAIKSWLETYDPKNEQNDTDWKDKIDKMLEEYAKDATGNIDKDKLPVIQNIKQVGSEPVPPPGVK